MTLSTSRLLRPALLVPVWSVASLASSILVLIIHIGSGVGACIISWYDAPPSGLVLATCEYRSRPADLG